MLIFRPDFVEGNEDYIILACDGLWDTVNPENAVELTDEYLKQGNSRLECAKMLVKEAKSRGSMDNISVIIVFLDAHKKVSSHPSNDTSVTNERTGPEESGTNHVEAKQEGISTVQTAENESFTDEKSHAHNETQEKT